MPSGLAAPSGGEGDDYIVETVIVLVIGIATLLVALLNFVLKLIELTRK